MLKRTYIERTWSRSIVFGLVLVLSTTFALPVLATCCCAMPVNSSHEQVAEVSASSGCCSEESDAMPYELSGYCCGEMEAQSGTLPASAITHVHETVELKRSVQALPTYVSAVSLINDKRFASSAYETASPSGAPIYMMITSLII